MGGNALLIYGSVRDALLQPRPAPRSIMDRLLGRVRTEVPTWSPIGRDRRMIDLPTDGLEGVAAAFRDFVATRFDPPWTSTAAVREYLRLDVINLYVRGDASGSSPPDWYVQLSFSGCAGMAEISSELAVHWAERWYRGNEADLRSRYLRPYGLEPDGRIAPDRSRAVFVPLGAAGYALYDSTPRPADEEYSESRYFEIDAAAMETLSDGERPAVLRKLDEEVPPLLPGDSCCCQLCAPDFDVAAYERHVLFR